MGAPLGRSFLLQAIAIGLAAIAGVFAAGLVLESVFLTQALKDEAAYYWDKRADDPSVPLPDTRNLTGFHKPFPGEFANLGPGFHEIQSRALPGMAYVTERDGESLLLIFDGTRIDELALFFGLGPLAIVLIVLYLTAWLAYRASERAYSPVIALAERVREFDPANPDPVLFAQAGLPAHADDEIRALADAMSLLAERLNAFIDRERMFTRDASHELRSPLTVIRMATDLLENDAGLPDGARRSVDRIRRAIDDMHGLIEAFLILAREADTGLPVERVSINDVVDDELRRARLFAGDKPIDASVHAEAQLEIDAPRRVLSVLVGNLLRNAFSYTDAGRVSVSIEPGRLVIEDTGIGMSPEQLSRAYEPFVRGDRTRGGHGVGLTIVRRLSDRFGWPVDIDSEVGVGTRVTVGFAQAKRAAGTEQAHGETPG